MKCKIISRMSRLTSSDGRVFAICSREILRHCNLSLIMLNLLLGTSLALTLDSNRRLETFKQKFKNATKDTFKISLEPVLHILIITSSQIWVFFEGS